MERLLRSKAFWTAVVSVIAVIVMRYTEIPAEIWQSVAALLAVVIGIFTVDDIEKGIVKEMRRATEQLREDFEILKK